MGWDWNSVRLETGSAKTGSAKTESAKTGSAGCFWNGRFRGDRLDICRGRVTWILCAGLLAVSVTAPSAWAKDPAKEDLFETSLLTQAKAIFAPLPEKVAREKVPVTDEQIALGKKLYSDTVLSSGQDISCNSCHGLTTYGVDNEKTSPGHKGQRGERNSPTVYNAALHISQFWDGRAATVEEQALGPILNPVEMAMPAAPEVLDRLNGDPEYRALFKKAFPGSNEITFEQVGLAIGAFERTLLTPSRFDAFLRGDTTALTDAEREGLSTFIETGCTACHAGATVGGSMYQKIGLVHPYDTKDLGRFNVTKNEADKYVFKVPSLRNIDKTGPYFHNGGVDTLEEAVRLMAYHQLGRELSKDQIDKIVVFLKSLTGPLPVEFAKSEQPAK